MWVVMKNVGDWAGVAVGGGWQAPVAYINLICYYVFGLPLGFLLGYKTRLGVQVKVSHYLSVFVWLGRFWWNIFICFRGFGLVWYVGLVFRLWSLCTWYTKPIGTKRYNIISILIITFLLNKFCNLERKKKTWINVHFSNITISQGGTSFGEDETMGSWIWEIRKNCNLKFLLTGLYIHLPVNVTVYT